MIEIKNSDLKAVLLTLAGFTKEGKMVQGLLTEQMSLGLKRKLQKIHTAAGKAYDELSKDLKEVAALEDKEKQTSEFKTLMDEVLKLEVDKASMEMIEAIVTTHFYDTEILEK